MKILTSFACVLLLLLTAHAQRKPELSGDGQRALELLLREEVFSDQAVGIGGITPESVKAFRLLIKEPNADSAFKHLLSEGKLAGQLYALCGLFFTDYGFFRTAVEPYRRSQKLVETQFGCIGGKKPIARVVESEDPMVLRLSSPKQTIDEWVHSRGADGFNVDVLGGGLPKMICGVP